MDSIMKGCISRILSLSCRDFWVTELVKFGLGLGLGYSLLLWIMIKSGRSSGSSGESGLILQFVPSPLRHRYAGQPSFLLFFLNPRCRCSSSSSRMQTQRIPLAIRMYLVSTIDMPTGWLPGCLAACLANLARYDPKAGLYCSFHFARWQPTMSGYKAPSLRLSLLVSGLSPFSTTGPGLAGTLIY